jgi:hypothetical protein
MALFSNEAIFRLNLIWGILDITLGLVGLYFIYRYVLAVLVLDADNRALLLGPNLSRWLPATDKLFILFGALYLSFKSVTLLITSARWEIALEKESADLQDNKKLKIKTKIKPKFFKLSDFTETR